MLLALAIGALGNLAGAAITGTATGLGHLVAECLHFVLGNVLGMLIGFMLGVLIRTSSGAIVAYFVYSFLLPTVFGMLAASQDGSATCSPGSTSSSRSARSSCSTARSLVSSGRTSA